MLKQGSYTLLGFFLLFALHLHGESTSFHFIPQEIKVASSLDESDWHREYRLGVAFLKEHEVQLALQALKRAEVLTPKELKEEKRNIQYAQLVVRYQNRDYKEVISFFEKTSLLYSNEEFAPFHDLLFMLHESYERTEAFQKADILLERIGKTYPNELEKLLMSQALFRKDFKKIGLLSDQNSKRGYLRELSGYYQKKMKSPKLAKWLGIICPGAGYLYAGQPKSATTSFLVNGLLIAASAQLFIAQYYTLGFLIATFEAGWYIGGILGGRDATTSYNNHLYQDFESKVTHHESLFMEPKLNEI